MKDICTAQYTNEHLHAQIDRDIETYLARGGTIESIPFGKSAVDVMTPKALNRAQAQKYIAARERRLAAALGVDDGDE